MKIPKNDRNNQNIKKRVWTEEKRAEQGELVRQYAKEHPDMVQRRSKKLNKPCVLEFNGKNMLFPSLKALKTYLWETYRFKVGERSKEQNMLKNRVPFTTTWERRKIFEGLKMYYVV